MPTRGQCLNSLPPDPKHSDPKHSKHSNLDPKHLLRLLIMGASFIAFDLIEGLWTGLAERGSSASPPAVSDMIDVLAEAKRFPGQWAYTADRHFCAVYHMPGGTWEVRCCTASEDAIAALRQGAGGQA
jgi:hypothetical protein